MGNKSRITNHSNRGFRKTWKHVRNLAEARLPRRDGSTWSGLAEKNVAPVVTIKGVKRRMGLPVVYNSAKYGPLRGHLA